MMIEGHFSNGFRRTLRDEDRACGRIDAGTLCLNGGSGNAQRYPLGSFARTAIEVPGYEDRSHQLGSNPAESNAQLHSLTRLTPCVKLSQKPRGSRRSPAQTPLLHFYSRACVGELLLDGLGFFLADAFFDWLRRAVDQVLRFLQAKAGDFAYRFNHVDLVRPGRSQHHRELRLLLRRRRRSRGSPAATRHHDRGCRCRRNSQLLFQHFHELRCLQQRQTLDLIRDCVNVRHFSRLLRISKNSWAGLPPTPETCFPSRPDPPRPPDSGPRHSSPSPAAAPAR